MSASDSDDVGSGASRLQQARLTLAAVP